MREAVVILAVVACLGALGCGAHGPRTVADPDPAVKIPAIRHAIDTHDRTAIPQLVKDLESDDSVVRFYASWGLQSLTGQTFGYRYFDDDEKRKASVTQWHQWMAAEKIARK
jgi:hypothetical protein